MKKIFAILINLLIFSSLSAQSLSLNVMLPSVMPYDFDAWKNNPGLVQVLVTNSTQNTLTNYKLGWKTIDLATGKTVSYTRKADLPSYNFPPGITSYPAGLLLFLPAVEIDDAYKNIAITTNSIPEGQYEFCVYLLNENGQLVSTTGNQCAYFQIIIPEPIALLNPENGDQILNNLPTFMWTSVQSGFPIKYRLKITPIFEGQTKVDAILANPILLQRDLSSPVYQYNLSDPPFNFYPNTTRFAWQVQAVDMQNVPVTQNNGNSEVREFVLAMNAPGDLTVDGTVSGCVTGEFGITTTVEGGSGNYTYAWRKNSVNFPSTTANVTGLQPGNYRVTVTDNTSGKTVNKTFEISNIQALTSSKDLTNCTSSNGEIRLEGRRCYGGNPRIDGNRKKYNFVISRLSPDPREIRRGEVEGDMPSNTASLNLANNLIAGSYRLTITDTRGCTALRNFIIKPSNSNVLFGLNSKPHDCINNVKGELKVASISGTTRYWVEYNGPSGFKRRGYKLDSLKELDAGEYFVTVTDTVTGCSKTMSRIISANAGSNLFRGVVSPVTGANAEDGFIQIIFKDKFDKVQSVEAAGSQGKIPAANIIKDAEGQLFRITGLRSGRYKVKVIFDPNCFSEMEYYIPDCSKPDFSVRIQENIILLRNKTFTVVITNMLKGQATLNFTGETNKKVPAPIKVNVSTANHSYKADLNNFEEGQYDLEIKDSRGCSKTISFNVFKESPDCQPGAKWTQLGIAPIFQLAPMWCWATCGEMIFRYYNVPNVNPADIYQCGIIGYMLGGVCNINCALCNMVGAPNSAFIQRMIRDYSSAASKKTIRLSSQHKNSALSFDEVKKEIDAKHPIIAGINTSGIDKRMTEHVSVVMGYNENKVKQKDGKEVTCKYIKVNDPFPFNQFGPNPYVKAGGKDLGNGQYEILYDDFVKKLVWKESFYDIK